MNVWQRNHSRSHEWLKGIKKCVERVESGSCGKKEERTIQIKELLKKETKSCMWLFELCYYSQCAYMLAYPEKLTCRESKQYKEDKGE